MKNLQFKGLPSGTTTSYNPSVIRAFETVDVSHIVANEQAVNLLSEFGAVRMSMGLVGFNDQSVREAMARIYEISNMSPDTVLDDFETFIVEGLEVDRGSGKTESEYQAEIAQKQGAYISAAKDILAGIQKAHAELQANPPAVQT